MKNIAVFFGGISVEHDISVITGVLTVNSVDKEKFNSFPVYVDGDGQWYTGEYLRDPDNYKNLDRRKLKRVTAVAGSDTFYIVKGSKLKPLCAVAAAINCMHGERGEDGSLAGLLNLCGIPLVSPPMLPSAVGMDKEFTKIAMKGLNVRTLPSVTVGRVEEAGTAKLPFGFPVIVKPACGGSSIGIRRAENRQELSDAAAYALRFGERAIIEPCISGFKEINCAAYRDKRGINVSECERPIGKDEVLSFYDKYESGRREFPADIGSEYSEKIKRTTARIYDKLGFEGIIRIDYFIHGGKVYMNEINSVPGSLAYYLFTDTLKGFTAVLTDLIEYCRAKYSAAASVQKSFNSGILKTVGGKSAKRL